MRWGSIAVHHLRQQKMVQNISCCIHMMAPSRKCRPVRPHILHTPETATLSNLKTTSAKAFSNKNITIMTNLRNNQISLQFTGDPWLSKDKRHIKENNCGGLALMSQGRTHSIPQFRIRVWRILDDFYKINHSSLS